VVKVVNYWLCVTNEENWHVVRKHMIWGVSRRSRRQIQKVKIDDKLVFYVTPQTLGGIFVAASAPFESEEQIFNWGEFGRPEIFPYRIKLKPLILPEKPLRFKEVMKNLRFIPNKQMWSCYLRKAIRDIPKVDFELIYSMIRREKHES